MIRIVAAATIDFSLIQARLYTNRERGRPAIGLITSLYVIDSSHIKWEWLQSLAVHNHSFVLKHGRKLARLSFIAVWQVTY